MSAITGDVILGFTSKIQLKGVGGIVAKSRWAVAATRLSEGDRVCLALAFILLCI